MSVGRTVGQAVGRPVGRGLSGYGSGDVYYALRLNFVQPSYSVTKSSTAKPSLRLNFVDSLYRARN